MRNKLGDLNCLINFIRGAYLTIDFVITSLNSDINTLIFLICFLKNI